ncbi:MarR family winged helix-turn-helix transcriptional regulator [Sphingomonas floccifaciens]|uniref:MarR family winged helix-turn-helix transcriptional regulator n=1 Tax=Sphingomonas floccifaciens TaxID=1844115 RepID=A0ABW4NEM5_9SPHN
MVLAPQLDQAVGFRLRRAVGVADTVFAQVFASLDVTTQQYAIIMTIQANPGCQPSALSALMGITPNNLVPQISGLVARKYVRRSSSSKDRRIKHLWLTAAGEAFAQDLIARHETIRARIEAHMGEEKMTELLDLLRLYSEMPRSEG